MLVILIGYLGTADFTVSLSLHDRDGCYSSQSSISPREVTLYSTWDYLSHYCLEVFRWRGGTILSYIYFSKQLLVFIKHCSVRLPSDWYLCLSLQVDLTLENYTPFLLTKTKCYLCT